jgi:hypothetical protein
MYVRKDLTGRWWINPGGEQCNLGSLNKTRIGLDIPVLPGVERRGIYLYLAGRNYLINFTEGNQPWYPSALTGGSATRENGVVFDNYLNPYKTR